MAYAVPNNAAIAVFLTARGRILGVAERTSSTSETLAAWSKVTDEAVDANPVTDRIRDFEPVTFLRTNPSAVAPPDDYDEEVLAGNCFYVIQGGRAYKVCR